MLFLSLVDNNTFLFFVRQKKKRKLKFLKKKETKKLH